MNISEALKAVDKEREYIYRKNEVDCKHEGFRKVVIADSDRRTDFYTLMSCGIGRGLNLSFEDCIADDWEIGELTQKEKIIYSECKKRVGGINKADMREHISFVKFIQL